MRGDGSLLADRSGFELLADLVPIPRKPTVAVLVLTLLGHRTLWELAKEYGAYACFHKRHTTGEDLDRAIHRAVELLEQMPKKDHNRPIEHTASVALSLKERDVFPVPALRSMDWEVFSRYQCCQAV